MLTPPIFSIKLIYNLRGPPSDIWGQAWSFCLNICIYFTREIESFNLFHLRIGWKYLFQYLYINIIFISTSCVGKIFISTISCGHLFISPIYLCHPGGGLVF